MKDKTVIVTGANSGIGKEISIGLARQGARVVMAVRNEEKGREALAEAKERSEGAGELELAVVDVASLDSVRAFAEKMLTVCSRLDVLVNNAGVFLPSRKSTPDGLEATMATNHFGPFLLTALLRPALAAAKGARVVTVASYGHVLGSLDLTDLNYERRSFDAMAVYGTSKLANILFARELHKRGASDRIVAASYHPGAVRTGFAQDESSFFGFLVKIGGPFLRSPQRGARTGIWLASSPDAADPGGLYYVDERPKKPSAAGRDDALAQKLWDASEKITKQAW